MSIDLSDWNEYIADDVPPGAIPCGIELETMQIVTCESFKICPEDGFPRGFKPKLESFKSRIFWRLKK